ncbi:MAG TPA: UDP-N-acetylmuramate--L-alanine ligase [bacterium]|nr:UDP-N-acetylmuramate--L-alanine ligase [bacterium]
MQSPYWFSGHIRTVHFVGIGGIGMSGLAEILINLKFRVQGSDLRESSAVTHLRALGATVYIGHDEKNIDGADVVVHTSAVKSDNPEIRAAWKQRMPVIRRAELLAELMRLQSGIAVAGTHGKTTTTSLVALLLNHSGLEPTVVIGGNANNIGANARVGDGYHLVAEADESDASFLYLTPDIAVVTNIEEEHLDHYRDLGQIMTTFREFLERVPFFGAAVVCGDDANIRSIIRTYRRRLIRYGMESHNDLVARMLPPDNGNQCFEVFYNQASIGTFALPVPGRHMILNALAAIGVGLILDIPASTMAEGLRLYRGVRRRMDVKGVVDDIMVVDDYAHHPTEIKATLETIRHWQPRPLTVVFQPHRYSRTKFFMDDFVTVLHLADTVIILPVYAASEDEFEGMPSDMLIEKCRDAYGDRILDARDLEHAVNILCDCVEPGGVILTLGAGSVSSIGDMYLEKKTATGNRNTRQ